MIGNGIVAAVDQSDDVGVVDVFLLVGEGDEVVEDLLKRLVVELVAQFGHPVAEGMPAAVLAQHEVRADEADVFRPHDFVGGALLQHAVLVDAGLVGEGVLPDDRLVPLDDHAGDRRDQPAGGAQLLRVDVRVEP